MPLYLPFIPALQREWSSLTAVSLLWPWAMWGFAPVAWFVSHSHMAVSRREQLKFISGSYSPADLRASCHVSSVAKRWWSRSHNSV